MIIGEQVTGLLRHVLTFGGGFAVARGWGDEATITAIIGGVTTIVGAVWSIWVKRQTPPQTPAA